DQIRWKDRGHAAGAWDVGEERRLAEEIAGHEIGEYDLFVARLLRHLHHPVADQVERVGRLGLFEYDGVFAEADQRGAVDELAEQRLGDVGEEIAAEGTQQEGLIDQRLRPRRVGQQLQDGLARDLDHPRRTDGPRRRRAAAAGDQTHLAE